MSSQFWSVGSRRPRLANPLVGYVEQPVQFTRIDGAIAWRTADMPEGTWNELSWLDKLSYVWTIPEGV